MTYELEYKDPPKAKAGTLTNTIQQMHVGQSFLIPNDDIKDVKKTQAAVHTIAANLNGVKMKTRTEDEGLRVYRIPHEPEQRAEIVEDVKPFNQAVSHQTREVTPNPVTFAKPPVEIELPIPKNEKLDNLRTLMSLASSGVKASEIYGDTDQYCTACHELLETANYSQGSFLYCKSGCDTPAAMTVYKEDWRFTKKATHYPDNGNAYREQVLYPAGKRFRNVRVDMDNQDEIIPE